jgi:hypothetical protein
MRFTAAAALAVFSGMLWFSVGREQLVPASPLLSMAPARSKDAVLVIVVRDAAAIEGLRRRIPREHIVSSHPDAIALAGGRIFATRIEAASAPLSELGWADRRLEIVDPASRATATSHAGPAAAGAGAENLATQETLTLGETLRLLDETSGVPPAPQR